MIMNNIMKHNRSIPPTFSPCWDGKHVYPLQHVVHLPTVMSCEAGSGTTQQAGGQVTPISRGNEMTTRVESVARPARKLKAGSFTWNLFSHAASPHFLSHSFGRRITCHKTSPTSCGTFGTLRRRAPFYGTLGLFLLSNPPACSKTW